MTHDRLTMILKAAQTPGSHGVEECYHVYPNGRFCSHSYSAHGPLDVDGHSFVPLVSLLREVAGLSHQEMYRNVITRSTAPPSKETGIVSGLIDEFRDVMTAASKWIRRIEERAEDLPESFFDNCAPAPLRKRMERLLAERQKDE